MLETTVAGSLPKPAWLREARMEQPDPGSGPTVVVHFRW